MGNNVQKKRKNSNFRTAKKRENISRPRFYGEWDSKIFEFRRIGPDLPVTFFLIATSLIKKNFVCLYRRATYLLEKKNTARRKKFFSPLPNIEEYELQINQSDRCLEDT